MLVTFLLAVYVFGIIFLGNLANKNHGDYEGTAFHMVGNLIVLLVGFAGDLGPDGGEVSDLHFFAVLIFFGILWTGYRMTKKSCGY